MVQLLGLVQLRYRYSMYVAVMVLRNRLFESRDVELVIVTSPSFFKYFIFNITFNFPSENRTHHSFAPSLLPTREANYRHHLSLHHLSLHHHHV